MTHTIGIIAEDESDVNSARVLIHRIAKNDRIKIKPKTAGGCGRLKRKCGAWAKDLKQRGCSLLIVIHDLDSRIQSELEKELIKLLEPCPFKNHLICIPVQEFEAWLLSDPNAIKKSMNLKNLPKVGEHPERINSPKEALEKIIYKASEKEKIYINTKHNEIIARHLSISLAKAKCKSFIPFDKFITEHFKAA